MTVTARSRRVPLTGAVLAVAALLATGCGPASSSDSANSAPTPSSPGAGSGAASSAVPSPSAVPSTSSAPPVPSPSPSPSAQGAGAGASASAPPACSTAHLHASIGGREGAAGSVYTTIDFANTGGAACTLYGYPGVSLANSGGSIGAPATRDRSHSPALITLSPGGKANAVLRVTTAQNYPSGKCSPDSSSFLLIYPPNQTEAIDVPYKSTGCKNSSVKLLQVRPVASGAGS